MLTNIDMEFIQAFNPLYAVPIIAVIICAFIVYAFGFKSPVQPPSFDGFQDEKKYTKKRRVRETQKSNKLVQNGRVNGSTVAKSNAAVTKKKDSTEKSSSNSEKAHATEKKANKKSRAPHEKKSPQEKKKESFSHDDINDDGWVQLVSKKERKNRKNETQSSATFINKTLEADDSSPIEESPKKSIPKISIKKNAGKESPKKNAAKDSPKKNKTKVETLQNIDSIDQNQFAPEPAEEKAAKDVKQSPNLEKSKIQNVVVEVSKSDNVEKQLLKEVAKETKVIEESSKSKKKKKKNIEVILHENEPLEKISDLATEQVISETLAPKKSAVTNSVTDSSTVKNNKVEENQPLEMKTSNVAFDELAGLYPEAKEQKKKKKVRREH